MPLNARSDLLTFQTASLGTDVEITGPITVNLHAGSSALDTDFTAKLIDVYPATADHPEELAINLIDSIIRARYRDSWEDQQLMHPGEVYAFTFQLYPTSNVFKKGNCIRLDISSSKFPRFDVNPNTGVKLGLERRFQVAEQTNYHNFVHPSQVVLPVIDRK